MIATGSSAFDLANRISEPLTGRKWEFYLFPFSHKELADHSGKENEKRLLELRMIYGYYPDVVNNPGNELKKSRKVYFYDNGLRNAVVNQFSPLAL